ncbi:YncE family protein [Mycobacterium sp. 852002-51057_SCH5723018]|uniref:YncE family protein n=1 Tax=Mycobacterium sp. 852002-51057_SCH5723018 TaxID=1834094 RepID=UPI0009ED0289|nr:YncE family protein [Mycobacterium sp. 852002-51057_SCH5723018]
MRDLNHRAGTPDGGPIELGAAPGFPIVAEIAVRNGPISGIAATPDGARLVVTNHGHDSVSVIDTDSCRVVETVEGLDEAFAVATGSADSARAYVSIVSPAYDSVGVIDLVTNTVVATHPLAFSVSDLAVSPDGRYVYASRNEAGGADVAVLDTVTGLVEAIDLSTRPGTTTECVRVSPDGARLYVATTSPAGGRLVMLARSAARWQLIGTVEIGLPIRDVALSPDGALAYVASCGPDWGAVIDVVDTRTVKITGTYKIGELSGILTGLTLSRDGDRAYVVSDDSVTVLCTLTHDVVGTLGVANQPSCVLESPNAKYLYFADYSGRLTVAPVASIVALGTGASVRTPEPALV